MIGEINYKIVVGVIHNFSAIMFFLSRFLFVAFLRACSQKEPMALLS